MTRDIKPTREAIWRAVLEYGSTAHLARALGVPREDLTSWLNGKTEMPVKKYEEMIELVAAHKGRRK
jgi:succinate dehydrogenase flavin-adding protein (antitoxin of CptAB toxin-antitoxin module)